MDNEYHPPHEHHEGEPGSQPEGAAPIDAATVVEQVRELLFGDHKRATESSLKALEDRLAALTATVEARFSDIERRLQEAKADTDHARDNHAETIGAALVELGERLKGLVAKPPEHQG